MGDRFKYLVSLLVFIMLASCRLRAADITLVLGGKSEFSLVIPVVADKKELKAASILGDYMLRVTGVRMPLIREDLFKGKHGIYIGHTRKALAGGEGKIQSDGVYISSTSTDVFLQGGAGQGIVYAAYEFADKYLGCRKYDAGPAFCPFNPNLSIAANISDLQNPSFIYRQSYYPLSNDAEYLQWHKLQKFEDLWGVWGHSFFKIIKPSAYFSTHPEYFSLVGGKRVAAQLCLSNPAVAELTIGWFKKAIQDNPDAVYWSISQNDGSGYCTCDQCKELDKKYGGPQGSVLNFVNKIAARFPASTFTTLAYGYSSNPPVNIVPARNVIVMLSSIDASRELPLEKSASARKFRENLAGWNQLTSHLFVWDYTTQFTNYLSPFPDYNSLIPNLAYLKSAHVSGIFSQGSGDTYGDLAELNSYIQAEGLWNAAANGQELIKDFIAGYYGKAAPYLLDYLSQMQAELVTSRAVLDIYGNPVRNDADYLKAALIKVYTHLFDQAEAAVQTDPLLLSRVQRARLSLTYARLQLAKANPESQEGYLQSGDGKVKVKPGFSLLVDKFADACKAAGVLELAENGAVPDEYRTQWSALLQADNQVNLAKNAKVTLRNPFSEEYPAKGAKTLTDGINGTADYSFSWLFMYGNDLDAVIDLGAPQKISTVSMGFLDDQRHNIYLPAAVIIKGSVDGVVYTDFAAVGYELHPAEVATISRLVYHGSGSFRYLRVYARCQQQLPAWKQQPGKKPALCSDEIVIR